MNKIAILLTLILKIRLFNSKIVNNSSGIKINSKKGSINNYSNSGGKKFQKNWQSQKIEI